VQHARIDGRGAQAILSQLCREDPAIAARCAELSGNGPEVRYRWDWMTSLVGVSTTAAGVIVPSATGGFELFGLKIGDTEPVLGVPMTDDMTSCIQPGQIQGELFEAKVLGFGVETWVDNAMDPADIAAFLRNVLNRTSAQLQLNRSNLQPLSNIKNYPNLSPSFSYGLGTLAAGAQAAAVAVTNDGNLEGMTKVDWKLEGNKDTVRIPLQINTNGLQGSNLVNAISFAITCTVGGILYTQLPAS